MSAPYQSKVDPYGFERPEDFDYETYDEFMSRYLRVLARRKQKWSSILNGGQRRLTRSAKIKRYIRKGVPNEERANVWMTMSGAEQRQNSNPELYRRLLEEPRDEFLVETITKDIHRTFPENIYFSEAVDSKRRELFNVLVAFAKNSRHVGYCQGLNFVAGLLLLVVKHEESAFWLLDALVNNILPSNYYSGDLQGLKVEQEVLSEIINNKCPQLGSLFRKEGVSYALVTTKWFICLYADILPVDTVLRIWDCLFYEGSKVLFRVAVTLIKRSQVKFLSECPKFSDIVHMFRKVTEDPHNMDCHQFMQQVFTEPGSFPMATIEKLRLSCAHKIEQG